MNARADLNLPHPCMGGWACPRRERCAHYHSRSRLEPCERLCSARSFDHWLDIDAPPAARQPVPTTPPPARHLEPTA